VKPFFYLLVVMIFSCRVLYAQPDKILAGPSEQQQMLVWDWYRNVLFKMDPAEVDAQLKNAESVFAEKNKPLLRRQVWLLQQLSKAERNANPIESAELMLSSASMASDKGWLFTEAECWHHAGTFYYVAGRYGPAFEYLRKAQQVFEAEENKNSPVVLRYTGMLGYSYYSFGEYELAIPYFKKTSELPAYWNKVLSFPNVYNSIGLCYRAIMKYDSAALWFNRAHDAARSMNDSFYMALAHGNLGYTYFLQNRYDESIPLLETDYEVSTKSREWGSAANAGLLLATIFIEKKQFHEAEKWMTLCRDFVYSNNDVNMRKKWYENLYHYYKARGEHKLIDRYADSLLMYKDSVTAFRDKRTYNQAVLKIEAEKHRTEVVELEHRRKQLIMLRNGLLIGVLLLGIIALLGANRQLLKRNKEKELAKKELLFAQQELMGYTQTLKEKNTLLEQLRNEIHNQQNGNDRVENLNKLFSTTILTDEDWKKFRDLYEKVYPGFFIRLKEKMPGLSAADTRLIALTKLQLPAKDMAAMLGVSYDAIKKARQRLRKKINLPEEGELEELVEMI